MEKKRGSRRLLVLDNHGSHTTIQFREFCNDNNIILLWMPPHSSHLCQPLDVGCFGPLKKAYSRQNELLIKNRIFHVTKEDFLVHFQRAFLASFTPANIQAGFRGAGLHPFDPEAVLGNLEPILLPTRYSTPSNSGSWHAQTPSNAQAVEHQTTLIRKKLQAHQGSSPTPIMDALKQLAKGAQQMATSSAIMQAQILALQQSNQLLQERRKVKRKVLKAKHGLSVGEGLKIIEQSQIIVETVEEMPRLTRKSPTCSNCKTQGHTKRDCTINRLDTTV